MPRSCLVEMNATSGVSGRRWFDPAGRILTRHSVLTQPVRYSATHVSKIFRRADCTNA
jgi:hypothetical protein